MTTPLNTPAHGGGLPQSPDPVPRVPNPGSGEAVAIGCKCAILDNCHGKRAPYPPDGWWITAGCPVHAPNPEAGAA